MDFLPSAEIIIGFSFAALLLAITPGPDMTLFLGRALAQGRAAGLATLCGTMAGTVVHTLLAVAGISALLAASPTGFWMLKIAGALYLLWLAFQAIVNRATFSLEPTGRRDRSWTGNFAMGLGVNLLNPKVVIFYMTFLPQFVSATDPAAWQKMLFLGLYFSALTSPLLALMVLAADKVADTLKRKPSVARTIDWLFGGVFAAFAVGILLEEGR